MPCIRRRSGAGYWIIRWPPGTDQLLEARNRGARRSRPISQSSRTDPKINFGASWTRSSQPLPSPQVRTTKNAEPSQRLARSRRHRNVWTPSAGEEAVVGSLANQEDSSNRSVSILASQRIARFGDAKWPFRSGHPGMGGSCGRTHRPAVRRTLVWPARPTFGHDRGLRMPSLGRPFMGRWRRAGCEWRPVRATGYVHRFRLGLRLWRTGRWRRRRATTGARGTAPA